MACGRGPRGIVGEADSQRRFVGTARQRTVDGRGMRASRMALASRMGPPCRQEHRTTWRPCRPAGVTFSAAQTTERKRRAGIGERIPPKLARCTRRTTRRLTSGAACWADLHADSNHRQSRSWSDTPTAPTTGNGSVEFDCAGAPARSTNRPSWDRLDSPHGNRAVPAPTTETCAARRGPARLRSSPYPVTSRWPSSRRSGVPAAHPSLVGSAPLAMTTEGRDQNAGTCSRMAARPLCIVLSGRPDELNP